MRLFYFQFIVHCHYVKFFTFIVNKRLSLVDAKVDSSVSVLGAGLENTRVKLYELEMRVQNIADRLMHNNSSHSKCPIMSKLL